MAPALRMPAEWEPQAATWLAWPHNQKDWPGKFGPIPWVFAEIARHTVTGQRLRLVVKDKAALRDAKTHLMRAQVDLRQVDFHVIPTDRGWMRDCGPIFVYDGQKRRMLDWRFTGWAKYANHKKDDKVPAAIGTCVEPVYKGKRVVLEGGAIDVNGRGSLLTTEECLLSAKVQCRNPGFTREDYEAVFAQYLGIRNTIWLGKGIVGDDTHGHVDDLARFTSPNTIVTVVESNRRDENYAPLQDNLKRLRQARSERGKPFTIAELPMPRPLYFEGVRVPASYANFLITNKSVLVPTFNDVNDCTALSILAELFPGREVIGIHALDLVWGLGTIHCLTQQEPL